MYKSNKNHLTKVEKLKSFDIKLDKALILFTFYVIGDFINTVSHYLNMKNILLQNFIVQ